MKRTIVAACILAITIGLCVGELIFMQNAVYSFKNCVKDIVFLVKNQELDNAIVQSEELLAAWRKKHAIMSTFIDHEPLREIETSFASLKAELEQEDFENFFVESETALINLDYLNVTEQPLLCNIL